jgi:hypothetical protein
MEGANGRVWATGLAGRQGREGKIEQHCGSRKVKLVDVGLEYCKAEGVVGGESSHHTVPATDGLPTQVLPPFHP